MADGDNNTKRVKRLLFPRRRKKLKLTVSEKWYQKTPRTINGKLRQAIMDALPFDVDRKQADIILRAIFDTIVEAVCKGETVTINTIGQFYPKYRAAHYHHFGKKWTSAHYRLAFKTAKTFVKEMNKDQDGNSGTD